jgi:hypothetical protein
MVESGVLDLIGAVLSQGDEVAGGLHRTPTAKYFPYSVKTTRESLLRVLLNLALSDKTVQSVAEDNGIKTGLVHAAADRTNLTSKTESLISQVQVRLKMVDGEGQLRQMKRVQEFSASSRHVMISYCWEQQEVVVRIKNALADRGYRCWLDVEQMSGSTVDAMADAIDHSYAVVYGISLEYKESANCRLEAMYAHQAKVQMIPLLLQENYTAKGWLGMLLGTQLWYGFFGATLATESSFTKQIDQLCRPLGSPDRGQRALWDVAKTNLMIAGGASKGKSSSTKQTMHAQMATPNAKEGSETPQVLTLPQPPSANKPTTSTPMAGDTPAGGNRGGGSGGAGYFFSSTPLSPTRTSALVPPSPLASPPPPPSVPFLSQSPQHETTFYASHTADVSQLLSHARENTIRLEQKCEQIVIKFEERSIQTVAKYEERHMQTAAKFEEQQHQTVAKYEERHVRCIADALSSAKYATRLEVELEAKQRTMMRLEGELKVVTELRFAEQMRFAERMTAAAAAHDRLVYVVAAAVATTAVVWRRSFI